MAEGDETTKRLRQSMAALDEAREVSDVEQRVSLPEATDCVLPTTWMRCSRICCGFVKDAEPPDPLPTYSVQVRLMAVLVEQLRSLRTPRCVPCR